MNRFSSSIDVGDRLVIRRLTEADLGAAVRVITSATASYSEWMPAAAIPTPDENATLVADALAAGDEAWIADCRGVALGLIVVSLRKGHAYLRLCFVHARHWGEGIASQLIRVTQQEAVKAGHSRMTLKTHADNQAARAAYERMGWRMTGTAPRWRGLKMVSYSTDLDAAVGG